MPRKQPPLTHGHRSGHCASASSSTAAIAAKGQEVADALRASALRCRARRWAGNPAGRGMPACLLLGHLRVADLRHAGGAQGSPHRGDVRAGLRAESPQPFARRSPAAHPLPDHIVSPGALPVPLRLTRSRRESDHPLRPTASPAPLLGAPARRFLTDPSFKVVSTTWFAAYPCLVWGKQRAASSSRPNGRGDSELRHSSDVTAIAEEAHFSVENKNRKYRMTSHG